MRLTNEVLSLFIEKFIVMYLDDFLVYRTSEEEHLEDRKKLFQVLR